MMTKNLTTKQLFICCIGASLVAILLLSYRSRAQTSTLLSAHSSDKILERAKHLASESVQSHALAMIAETQVEHGVPFSVQNVWDD
jgi:hypothetical protein